MGRKECGFLPLAPAPLPSAQETVISPLKGFHLGTSFNSKLSSLTWSSNKGQELLGRRAMANLDSVLKSTDTTLRTKVHKVKAMVFPVVMYRCESWTIKKAVAATAKSLQSCPTLCDLIVGSPPGSSIPGILQARTLEWVAISFSNA